MSLLGKPKENQQHLSTFWVSLRKGEPDLNLGVGVTEMFTWRWMQTSRDFFRGRVSLLKQVPAKRVPPTFFCHGILLNDWAKYCMKPPPVFCVQPWFCRASTIGIIYLKPKQKIPSKRSSGDVLWVIFHMASGHRRDVFVSSSRHQL